MAVLKYLVMCLTSIVSVRWPVLMGKQLLHYTSHHAVELSLQHLSTSEKLSNDVPYEIFPKEFYSVE